MSVHYMQEDSDPQHILKIGDTVLLYAREMKGYISCELTSSAHNCVAVTSSKTLPNVHFATFRVIAANKYEAQEHHRRLVRLHKVKPKLVSELDVDKWKKQVDVELSENKAEQDRLEGSPLVYGESIQLVHTLTKKYLSINNTHTSLTEDTSLKVELRREDSIKCIFKVLPRYRVRSVGDQVCYNDQVKLECVATDGQFLHCSTRQLGEVGFTVLAHCHEVNLSATESSLTLVPHYRPQPHDKLKAFRAGGTVRLFHCEYDCYIAAEGSFAEDPAVIEDVHCRKRRSDHGILKPPSTSSNTYWQFEKESDPVSGEPILWGERVRIKHLPTRCYLAVVEYPEGSYKLTLKTPGSVWPGDRLDSVFSLFPVIQEGDSIVLESYARIKHLPTGYWLHLNKDRKYKRQNFDPTVPGLSGLEWDSADLFMLTVSKIRGYHDAFTLEQVPEDMVDNFNYVAGIVPVLTTHISECTGRCVPLRSRSTYGAVKALRELSEFLQTPDPRENKNRQKLLRNLRVLELLLNILALFDPKARDASEHRQVCQACYQVIDSYLEGDSRKNENYLARHIEFFRTQVRKGLDAEQVMIQMVEDNPAIVSRMATEDQIDFVITQLLETKDPRFMGFLGNLCVCSGRPIPSTQNIILDKLVIGHGKDVFYRTTVGGSEVLPQGKRGVVYVQDAGSSVVWQELENIASVEQSDGARFKFLEAQMLVFARLCRGNNPHAVQTLDVNGYITFTESLLCARNVRLHPDIRARYVELITVMFVDVGDNQDALENLSLVFVYDQISEHPYERTGSDPYESMMGVRNEHFPQLKVWIEEHIEQFLSYKPKTPSPDDVPVSNLMAQVLSALYLLVKCGYYDDYSDVEDVLRPLTTLLATAECTTSTENQEGNRALHKVKQKAMEVIDLFFNFHSYCQLQRFIFDYRVLCDNEVGEVEIPPPRELALLKDSKGESTLDPSMVNRVRDRLHFLFSNKHFYKCSAEGDTLPQILLDLSRYESNDLVQSSLHLLNRYYSSELSLFKKGVQTQLLVTEESKKVFNEVRELVPTLVHYMRIDAGEEQRTEIIRILHIFTRMCIYDDAKLEPHGQNQRILYNFGLLSDVLNYVLHCTHAPGSRASLPLSSHTRGQTQGAFSNHKVFIECFQFLRAMASKNKEVQLRLYDRMSELLETEVAVPFMAEVLSEVFTGGPEICLKVREDQVERMFQILAQGKGDGQTEIIMTLQAIAKVDKLDLPIKRNQASVIKYFSKTRQFCDHLLDSEKEEFRWSVLSEVLDENYDLQLLLNITDLLATCAEGENPFIESVCQTVFPVEELLRILSCPTISARRKRPFARFLVSVYMNTADDKMQTGAGRLQHDDLMWNYLDHLATLMTNIGQVLHGVSQTDEDLVKRGLTGASRRHDSLEPTTGYKRVKTRKRLVPFVTDRDGVLLPDVLEYFMKGVLPMLKLFYTEFFQPNKTETQNREISISTYLCSALMDLAEVISKYFTTEGQVELYRTTALSMLHHSEIRERVNAEDRLMDNLELYVGGITFEMQRYKDTYACEVKMNEEFHRFVSNYRRAYEGPNTASHQLQRELTFHTSYNSEDGEGEGGGGEDLPLGPSFQRHIACFTFSSGPKRVKPEAERLLYKLQLSFRNIKYQNELDRAKQDEVDIKCLQILRAIIHNEIMLIDPDLKPALLREQYKATLHPVQNAIQKFGPQQNALQSLIPLLSHPNDAISCEVLAFLRVLLYSGNRTVQEGLWYLQETREEGLFATLQKRLEQAAVHFREKHELEAQMEHRSQSQPGQTYVHKPEVLAASPKVLVPQLSEDIPLLDLTEVDSAPPSPHPLRARYDPNHPPPSDAVVIRTPTAGKRWFRRASAESPKRKASRHLPDISEGKTLSRPHHVELTTAGDLHSIQLEDTSHIKLTLRVLGLWCDGQYDAMQNYLRRQSINIRTMNIVGEVAQFLQNLLQCNEICPGNIDLIHRTLQTLIEFCVGNYSNQSVIFNHQIIDNINRILKSRVDHPDIDPCNVIKLKGSAVELLEAMLEETSDKTKELAKGIFSTLDKEAALRTLVFFYHCKHDRRVKRAGRNEEAEHGLFRTYHILVHLADYPGISLEQLAPHKDSPADVRMAWEFCKERSKSIEVCYENQQGEKILTRVHFKFEKQDELRREVREKVKWGVNRDTPEDKLRDFLKWMLAIKKDSEHNNSLHKHWWSRILIAYPGYRHMAIIFVTLLLNLFMLITFMIPSDKRPSERIPTTNVTWDVRVLTPEVDIWYGDYCLYIFGAAHLILSLWMVIEFFVVMWPNFVIPRVFYRIMSREPPVRTYSSVRLLGLNTIYILVFLLVSTAGLATYGYFYCLCLLHIIVNNDILQRVLRSITKNGKQLLWVAALGVVILYMYAVVSFAFLHESFFTTDAESLLFCSSLVQCFVSTIRYGLIDNLALHIPVAPPEFSVVAVRLLYDLSFFIIVTTIGLNLIFGIILDTFSELRAERMHTEQDKKGLCFICSFPNHEFQRKAKGFDRHTEDEHNMWNYIYFSLHLDKIDVSDHNAIEGYVHRMITMEQIGFFPLRMARVLEMAEDESSQQMKVLTDKVDAILHRFHQEERERTLRGKREEQERWEEENRLRKSLSSYRAGTLASVTFDEQ